MLEKHAEDTRRKKEHFRRKSLLEKAKENERYTSGFDSGSFKATPRSSIQSKDFKGQLSGTQGKDGKMEDGNV